VLPSNEIHHTSGLTCVIWVEKGRETPSLLAKTKISATGAIHSKEKDKRRGRFLR
jgi:hypothetical protein